MKNDRKNINTIINHLKNSGFVFQSSEIYGGLANTWDYGPLGILLINNIKKEWWKNFIIKEKNNIGIDSKILLNPNVWKASGHLSNFSDLLIENKINNKSKKMDDEYEIMSSIYAYLDLINFLKGDEVSVLKLKEIRNLCVKDKFIKPLRLLNGLDVFNDEDVIYVEELCVDYDINNTAGQYIKKMVKDK